MKKKVFVSGASKGIGRAIVKALDTEEYEIIGCARSNSDLESLKSELKVARFESLNLDLSTEEGVKELKNYFDLNGEAEVIIANYNFSKPYKKIQSYDSHSEFFESISSHLNYLVSIAPQVMAHQRAVGFGRWIGISSAVSKLNGVQGQAFYLMQKRMLESLIDSLAIEVDHPNITANCVLPGLVETERLKGNNKFEELKKMNLANRAAQPDEIAALVAFLISEKAGFITGEKFSIDGGASKTWMINRLIENKK